MNNITQSPPTRSTMVVLAEDQVERLDKIAKRQLMSRSLLIRQAVADLLRRMEREQEVSA